MSMKHIRDCYGVPAKRGMEVEYMPLDGVAMRGIIVRARCGRLIIRLCGDKKPMSFHPAYRLNYIGADGAVLWRSLGVI